MFLHPFLCLVVFSVFLHASVLGGVFLFLQLVSVLVVFSLFIGVFF